MAMLTVALLMVLAMIGSVASATAPPLCGSGTHATMLAARPDLEERCGRMSRDDTVTSNVPTPQVVHVTWVHGAVRIAWNRSISVGADGVNVYRDGHHVATVTEGDVYDDVGGGLGSVYQLVGFKDGWSSEPSPFYAASSGVTAGLDVTGLGDGLAELSWIANGLPPMAHDSIVYGLLPDGRGGVRVRAVETAQQEGLHSESSVVIPITGEGELFFVVLVDGNRVLAVSGVRSVIGSGCLVNCDGSVLSDLDSDSDSGLDSGVVARSRRPLRIEIVREIIRDVERFVGVCLQVGCSSVVREVVDSFLAADPTEVSAGAMA